MGRLHRRRPKKIKPCIGCGHSIHGYYCGRFDKVRGRFHWCSCHHEKPLTKRKRRRVTARSHSRRRIGWSAPEQPVIGNKKVARLNELYDNILDDALPEQ